jgi:uncharacterized protein DUF4279
VNERTRVSVVGAPAFVVTGGTPYQAPFLANDLLEQLLASADGPEATIRIELAVRSLLTFSFELQPYIVDRLAQFGAALEVCINDELPRFEHFGATEAGALVDVWTDDKDPYELTERLGITPSEVHAAGEAFGKRTYQRGFWRVELRATPPIDLGGLILDLCARFPPRAAAAARDHDVRLRLAFMIEQLRGGFRLGREVIARIAELRVPLACYFYNAGA